MAKIVHVIGNGPSAGLYDPNVKGIKYTCNLPPFEVPGSRGTFMVDFKMMQAIHSGGVVVPGDWILGTRPKRWTEMQPGFYMKYAPQIKEFYLDLPKYASNATDFNCGHMAVRYCAQKVKADEIHMYGFNSIFEFDLRSSTDFYLEADRTVENSARLSNNWRPIWKHMFHEFPETQFVLYHTSDVSKIPLPANVRVHTGK